MVGERGNGSLGGELTLPPPILRSVLGICWWFVKRKRYPLMDRGMLMSKLMVIWVMRLRLLRWQEKTLGRRKEGTGTETFWSGRILEAPCPLPLQGRLGHWTLADRRVSTLPRLPRWDNPEGRTDHS